MNIDLFFDLFDLVGTLVFAISGALVAVKKKLDVYGIFILAIVTALGGGMIRDVLLGRTPPVVFTHIQYVGFSCLGALLVLVFHRKIEKLKHPMRIMDAIGLGIFTVIGAKTTLSSGGSWYAAIMLGIITGTGGGMVRDVLAKEVPVVLQREVYAVASLLGAVLYILWLQVPPIQGLKDIQASVGAILAAAITATTRIVAVYRNWHLPRIGGSNEMNDTTGHE